MKKKNILALMMLFVFFMATFGMVARSCTPVTHTLTITISSCDGSPNSGTNPRTGIFTYTEGTYINGIVAIPNTGYFFDHWVFDGVSGGYGNTIAPTIWMNTDHTLMAVFNPTLTLPPPTPNVTLTILKFSCKPVSEFTSAYGSITPDVGNYSVPVGTTVTFNATGGIVYGIQYALMNWNVNGKDFYATPYQNTTMTITITANTIVYAMFNPHITQKTITPPPPPLPPPPPPPVTNETYILHISKFACTGATANFGDVSPDVGDYIVTDGTQVTITAHAATGWAFNAWIIYINGIPTQGNGLPYPNQNIITVTVNSNMDVEAEFNPY